MSTTTDFDPEQLIDYLTEKDQKNEVINTKELLPLVLTNTASALIYAVSVLQKRVPEVEELLAKEDSDAKGSLIIGYLAPLYDEGIVVKDGPVWDELLKSPELCVRYSQFVSEDRFPEGEPAIMNGDSKYREDYMALLKKFKEVKRESEEDNTSSDS